MPEVTYGFPDPDCTVCLGHGVKPDGSDWCECQEEKQTGPICTKDGVPVPLQKFFCRGGCGEHVFFAPHEGMNFTCSRCRIPMEDCPECEGTGWTLSRMGQTNVPLGSTAGGDMVVNCDCWKSRYAMPAIVQ